MAVDIEEIREDYYVVEDKDGFAYNFIFDTIDKAVKFLKTIKPTERKKKGLRIRHKIIAYIDKSVEI